MRSCPSIVDPACWRSQMKGAYPRIFQLPDRRNLCRQMKDQPSISDGPFGTLTTLTEPGLLMSAHLLISAQAIKFNCTQRIGMSSSILTTCSVQQSFVLPHSGTCKYTTQPLGIEFCSPHLNNGKDLLVSKVVSGASLVPVGGVQDASLHKFRGRGLQLA